MTEKNSKIIRKFMEYIRHSDTEDFMRGMLYCFSAPTIKGIKSASLINFRRYSGENIKSIWLSHADEWLSPFGLEWVLLNEGCESDKALVLIYRRELLAKALGCDGACCILEANGYPLNDVDACLECLRGKFGTGFPHEIGLFLDYPPDDVRGFMENRCAKNLSCKGYWKVYGDVRGARRKFRRYRKAECEAACLIMNGGKLI